ncbi:MAG TPA: carboxymuconolactone decarboxylase family protein [Thermoleophilaceae bacterium]|nr:carboxymuconolactone decarboxylase family protein [Thermoleophilaceae bacterium]
MARLPLPDPAELPAYLRDLHDAASDGDWSTRHVARAFSPAPELLETYLTGFYYPWHTNTDQADGPARLSPRVKELVRLRIATLNGCKTCKAARLAPDTVSEPQATGIDVYEQSPDYSPAEKAAVAFAERLALDHHSIGDADILALREHFDDAEILELMMMAGQYIGFGRMLAVLQLETVACPLPATTGGSGVGNA